MIDNCKRCNAMCTVRITSEGCFVLAYNAEYACTQYRERNVTPLADGGWVMDGFCTGPVRKTEIEAIESWNELQASVK